MSAYAESTQISRKIKRNNIICSKKLTSKAITSYGSSLFGAKSFAQNSTFDSSGNWSFGGNK